MIAIGIDPDAHATALAITTRERVVAVEVVKVSKSFKGQRAVEAMIMELSRAIPNWIRHLMAAGEIGHPTLIVAEGQQIYAGGKTKNWDSITMLGPITGAAAGICLTNSCADLLVPKPGEWKGDIPKAVHQARVLKRRAIPYEVRGSKGPGRDSRYVVPTGGLGDIRQSRELLAGDWKHAVDAIGLADWGLAKLKAAL
jgi:hypothetical protein